MSGEKRQEITEMKNVEINKSVIEKESAKMGKKKMVICDHATKNCKDCAASSPHVCVIVGESKCCVGGKLVIVKCIPVKRKKK